VFIRVISGRCSEAPIQRGQVDPLGHPVRRLLAPLRQQRLGHFPKKVSKTSERLSRLGLRARCRKPDGPMRRRKRDRTWDNAELAIRLGVGLLILAALSIGGVTGFAQALGGILRLALVAVFSACALGLLFLLVRAGVRARRESRSSLHQAPAGWPDLAAKPVVRAQYTGGVEPAPPTTSAAEPFVWSASNIRSALDEIDWYQFEKFCAALLQADGFRVERKGGAHPDGGVDLVVEKAGARALIQCKHWRTWTTPAATFAAEHAITLVDGKHLAESAATQFTAQQLTALLRSGMQHCPKCESLMVERKGAFGSFMGCSTYPRCRGKLKHAGAR
jgi:hypothetical protein